MLIYPSLHAGSVSSVGLPPVPENLREILEEFIDRDNSIAVVGASRNPEKWGYKLYRYFKLAGYRRVYPVNPSADSIDGDVAYPSLASLPEPPGVVNVVVPPKVARQVAMEAVKLGLKRIWFQPGSEDEEAIRTCLDAGMKVVWGLCMMAESKKRGLIL